jgi:hypothetical protein
MAVKKVSFEFNPFKETELKVPKDKKEEALEEIQDFVREQVLSHVGEGRSPVQGGAWKKSLSSEYKQVKKKFSSVGFANLEMEGEMLDALEVKRLNSERLSLQVTGEQAGKAEGNNLGSYGKSPDRSKAREFIPQSNQTLKKEIWKGIEEILKKYGRD